MVIFLHKKIVLKVLAFGGSNTIHSINKSLTQYAASLLNAHEVTLVNINDYPVPIYSLDTEANIGIPDEAVAFSKLIDASDLLLISMAENNGSYNVGFKNLIDWLSRIKNRKTFGNKKVFLIATSPGKRGGTTVLTGAVNYFPFIGAEVVGSFSLPEFNVNFKDGKVVDEDLNASLKLALEAL